MMEILQEKNKGKIIICNTGSFYIAIGKDAILLNKIANLKLSCLKPEICKVGFPIQSLEKYIDIIQESRYSCIIYYFDKEKTELEVLWDYNGKSNKIKEQKENCYICKKTTKPYNKQDKYMVALAKLFEKETGEKHE